MEGENSMNKKKEATAFAMTSNSQYKDTENLSDNEVIKVDIPENSKLDSTVILPTWGIPIKIRESIQCIANVYGCSPDYVFMGYMMAVSAAIGKKIQLNDGKYLNYGTFWTMFVGRQGINKSEPLKQALKPLFELEIFRNIEYKQQLEQWHEGQPKPVLKQNIAIDITPEALYELMGKGFAITSYYDEIASMEENKNRYTNSGESPTSMSIYSGSPLTINRKGSEPIFIPNPFLNITGTIQPETLVKTFGKEVYINNGYLSRWLFVYPDNQEIQLYNENSLDDSIVIYYKEFILRIVNSPDLGTITFTSEARKLYADYYNSLQLKKMNAMDDYESGIYSKLQINVQRWALIVFVARFFELKEKMEISDEVMQYSIECMQYFEYTAMKVRNMIIGNRTPMKEMNDSELIRLFYNRFSNPNNKISDLARYMGKSREYLSKVINRK